MDDGRWPMDDSYPLETTSVFDIVIAIAIAIIAIFLLYSTSLSRSLST
jgi:hypothetical protein